METLEVRSSECGVRSENKFRTSLFVLVIFLFFFMAGTATADVTKHVLARIEELSLGIRSYKANYDLILQLKEGEVKMKGSLLYKWPEQVRNEMSVDSTPGLGQIIYLQKGISWQYLPSSKVAFREQEERLRRQFPEIFASQDLINLRSPFDLVEAGSLRFLEEERGEGDEASYLFEGTPKKAIQIQGSLAPRLCRFRISNRDGLLRDFVMYDEGGQEIYKQHFWDVQVNLELLDEEFEFQLPDDVQIVEVTKQTKKRLEALAQKGSP